MKQSTPKPEMFLGASARQFQLAKTLRAHETEAEKILWCRLKGKQLGVKFRRQHPLHDFIADFYCHSHRLVIEVDGEIHHTPQNKSYDLSRTEAFSTFGIKTIRFTNAEVIHHTDAVIASIKSTLNQTTLPPSGGEGVDTTLPPSLGKSSTLPPLGGQGVDSPLAGQGADQP